jgi:hypothetical protein
MNQPNNFETLIRISVKQYRDERYARHQQELNEFVKMRDHYDAYAEQDRLPIPQVLKEIKTLTNQIHADRAVKDESYVDELIGKIQRQWGVTSSFLGVVELNQKICDVLMILPVGLELKFITVSAHTTLTMWLYNHSGEFWLPENKGDVFQHLNRIFNPGGQAAFLHEDFDDDVYYRLLKNDAPLKEPLSSKKDFFKTQQIVIAITDTVCKCLNM